MTQRAVWWIAAMLALATILAGCTSPREPEESVQEIGDPIIVDTIPIVEDPARATLPADGSRSDSTVGGDGIEYGGAQVIETSAPIAPAPQPAPAAAPEPAPTPGPTAPAPAPAPPAPAPAPAPAPVAPSPDPSPSPNPTPTSPTPKPPTQQPTWPREGSRVSYSIVVREEWTGGDPHAWMTYTNATWTYARGDWRGSCAGERIQFNNEVEEGREPISRDFVPSDPPHWPLFDTTTPGPTGSTITSWYMQGCSILSRSAVFQGVSDNDVEFFHATGPADSGPDGGYVTRWSRSTGLVGMWDLRETDMHTHGELKVS